MASDPTNPTDPTDKEHLRRSTYAMMSLAKVTLVVMLLLIISIRPSSAQINPLVALRIVVGATSSAKGDSWRFSPVDVPGAEAVDFDDTAWKSAKLAYTYGDGPIGWARAKIVIPQQIQGFPVSGGVTLNLSVDDDGEAYVNGKLIKTFHWDAGAVPLTDDAKPGDTFVVAVKIINTGGPGSLGAATLSFDQFAPCRLFLDDYYFASAMTGFNPGTSGPTYKKALADAVAAIDVPACRQGNAAALLASIGRATDKLKPFSDAASQYTCHIIGHAHIDMNWLWLWPETVEVCNNTFQSVCNIMDEYPGFTFSQSQPTTYCAVQETNPQLFAEMKKQIEAGRWEITGGTWVEGDMNLASGESMVRQILYARKYYRDTFGKETQVYWAPDTFGHAWTVPQILKKSGLNYMMFVRCAPGPRMFWWESPDGSRVLVFNMLSYSGPVHGGLPELTIRQANEMGAKDAPFIYGVGDHGGGPTRADVVHAHSFDGRTVLPNIEFSTAKNFFASVKDQKNLPVVKDEINFEFRGAYTSHGDIKLMNRKAENLLPTAEAFSTIAGLYGYAYPQQGFRDSWHKACFNQFHDILAGTAIHGSYDYSKEVFEELERQASSALQGSLRHIADRINTQQDGVPVVVFNPLAWPRTDTVDTACPFPEKDALIYVVDSMGRHLPAQRVGDHVTFIAKDVPSLGYATYWIRRGDISRDVVPAVRAERIGNRLRIENEFLIVEVDKTSGNLVRVYDKQARREALRDSAIQALSEGHVDMSSWDIGPITGTENLPKARIAEFMQQGPVTCSIRVDHIYKKSMFAQDISLSAGMPCVEIHLSADWQEIGSEKTGSTMMKAAFTANVKDGKATFEIPYGAIERKADGSEVPALKWIDLSNESYGVSLLNNCKYGHDVNGNTMRLTLLRSSYDPDPRPDVGMHDMTYSLYPHNGDWRTAGTVRRGYELNNPLVAVQPGSHKGPLSAVQSYLGVDAPNVIVAAFKQREDGNGTILRFYESSGKATKATIRVPGSYTTWTETDMVEQPLKNKAHKITNGRIYLPIGKYEVKTLLLN